MSSQRHLYRTTKRLLDIVAAAAAIVVLFPLILLSMLVVRLSMGSPVLFRQQRPGIHGKPFTMVKLRTMRDAVDAKGRPLSDAERMTKWGWFFRTTSVDELPALWNVLKGDMSLVGPRPLLMQYLDRYTPRQARRHEVKPGITGWAQVNGRNGVPWEERLEMDVWYVDNQSLLLDLKILALTVLKVFKRDGISAEGHATMPEFQGTGGSDGGDLFVYGAGGHARVIIATAEAAGRSVTGIFDDDPAKAGGSLDGVPIIGSFDASMLAGAELVLALGDNTARRCMAEALGDSVRWATLVHPHALVHRSVAVGAGTVVFAGSIIQPGARLGNHCIINTGATVDHDCTIGDFVHVAPGTHLAGGVRVGDSVLLGIASTVIPNISLGDRVRVGAGGVVVDDVEPDQTVVGVPARAILPTGKALNGYLAQSRHAESIPQRISLTPVGGR